MPTLVHYEVYVQEQRGWILQGRYPGDERDVAIADAKALELDTRLPVRVLKETYSTESSEGTESLVYKGRFQPKAGSSMQRINSGGPAGAPRGAIETAGMGDAAPFSLSDIEAHYGEQAMRSRGRATADFMIRMIMVLGASLGLAVLGTALVSVILGRSGAISSGGAHSMLLFLVFMALFLATAVPSAMKYLPQDLFNPPQGGPQQRKPSFWKQLAVVLWPAPRPDDLVPEAPPPPPVAPAAKADPVQPPAPVAEAPAEPPPADAADSAAAQAQAAKDAASAESAAPAEETPDEAKAENPRFEKARMAAMKFLGGAVNAIKTTHPQLDAYNKFGVNLYLAGACDALAKAHQLDELRQADLVRECVEVIGTRPDQARQLVERLGGYRNETRYHQMIAAGFTAMEVYLSGHSDPFIAIGGVMKDWNTPQSRQIASNAVTLLFTDMVGSTDMTQAVGDMAAQDVIRAHNHIVRTALSHFGGREVKHTGDGIMASFDEPEDAVRAAVEIQQRAAQHTARWPKLPLRLRIGMNTGEPIIEENDYFGATVQIAARVCAAAGADQVWVAQATRTLVPATSGLRFRDRGPHSLKGVTEKITLHEVLWSEPAGKPVPGATITAAGTKLPPTPATAPRPAPVPAEPPKATAATPTAAPAAAAKPPLKAS
ncbi:adenylate/guanylate cyclase domain-containing protein [Novispirillum sp. DQ9]|uniref:adenylate/guanylate cyclase domain-containing protein n=1 Tax=Novispirillum sp. DQ9 TaxID=3398612 RepID=UPI003C7DA74D